MSTDWSNAFGGGDGQKKPEQLMKESVDCVAAADNKARESFDRLVKASAPHEEAGLLSDEAAEVLKAKAAETGKRLAEGLGKSAARTADIVGRLGGQGATHARALADRLKGDAGKHNMKVVAIAGLGLAFVLGVSYVWHTHASNDAPTTPVASMPKTPVAPAQVAQASPSSAITPAPVTSVATPALVQTPPPQPVAHVSVAPASVVSPPKAMATSQVSANPVPKPVRVASHAAPGSSPSAADINKQWTQDANAKMDAWFKARQQAQQGSH